MPIIPGFAPAKQKKIDLSEIGGLERQAEISGFGKRAEEILAKKGEKPKEFLSGGFISDTFDVLNAAQYGVTGLLKGKSFMEGVKTRQSFTDQDALGNKGLPGVIAGIALDIAVDPLTYIAPISVVKKIPLAEKGLTTVKTAFFNTRLGQGLGSRFIYRFGQDSVYKELDERRIKNIGVGINNLLDTVRPLTKLDTATQKTIAEARKAGELEKLTPELLEKSKPAFDELDKLGKEAVEAGLLKKETYDENVGKYIARLYRKYEIPKFQPFAPELKLLAQEARKYKSAEEFVNNQQQVFRGGTKFDATKMNAEGTPFTVDNKVAEQFARIKNQFDSGPVGQALGKSKGQNITEKFYISSDAKIATRTDIPQDVFDAYKQANPLTKPDVAEPIVNNWAKANGFDGIDYRTLGKTSAKEAEIKILNPNVLKTKSQLTDFYNQAVRGITEIPITGKIKIPPGAEKKPLRIDLSRFKKRKDISEDVREAMGEILEAGYPTAKALVQLKSAVENAKFFKQIEKNWGDMFTKNSAEAIEKKLSRLSDTPRLGNLSGLWVPKPIADSINEIVRIKSPAEKVLSNYLVTPFKFGKVVLNPGTHGRNIISNFLLNSFEGLSPARLDIYAKAVKEIAIKGDLYKEAKATGLGIDTFASQELRQFLISPEITALGKAKNLTKAALNKASDLYQKEEEWAKMAMYIFQKGKGLSPEEALKIAERATFNYAQVTPFIRRIREAVWGYPFITFSFKVTPQVAKTLITKPTKISNIGKIKQGIENQADLQELAKERANEPQWIRDGFYLKLPVKDKHGRSMYFDMTYIMPFGDLISGELLTRDISRETGLPETPAEALIKKTPFINMIKELGKNQDFRGDKIVRDSDEPAKQGADIMRYLTKMMTPPLIGEQLPGGITRAGERRPGRIAGILEQQKKAAAGEEIFGRTPMFELLRNVGLKIDPIDAELQEKYMNAEKRKALQTLLKEYDVIEEFKKPFIPKEKKEKRKPTRIPGF